VRDTMSIDARGHQGVVFACTCCCVGAWLRVCVAVVTAAWHTVGGQCERARRR